MKRWSLLASFVTALTLLLAAGCTSLDEKQRAWIFQPSDRAWGGLTSEGMEDVWIEFDSKVAKEPAKLHGLWMAAEKPGAPVLLYLHGARWNVTGSAPRIRRMQELGFSVLAVDYRGFGQSTNVLPSEATAYEDARQAWAWLAAKYPGTPRYIFGHSLGGAIAIDLATNVDDEKGVMVEGTFTSIPEVFNTFKWGWLPVNALITQRFESLRKVDKVGSPILIVHGSNDSLILPSLGKKLFEAAKGPKEFLLVDGGSHHNTNSVGQAQYREALGRLFSLN
ncbi:MAG: alpha/beta fold hydrolase [Burkholderiaceae bacterium]